MQKAINKIFELLAEYLVGIFCASIIFIPAVPTIMSGCGYYARWELVIILYFVYLTFLTWDDIESLSWVQKLVSVGIWLVLIMYGVLEKSLAQDNYRFVLLSYGGFLILILLILPVCRKWNMSRLGNIIFIIVAVLSIHKSWILVAGDLEIDSVRQENVVQELIPKEEQFYRIDYERVFEEPRLNMNISLMPLTFPWSYN